MENNTEEEIGIYFFKGSIGKFTFLVLKHITKQQVSKQNDFVLNSIKCLSDPRHCRNTNMKTLSLPSRGLWFGVVKSTLSGDRPGIKPLLVSSCGILDKLLNGPESQVQHL